MNILQTLASMSNTMTPEQREETRNAINAVIGTMTDPDAIAMMEIFREYHFGTPEARKAIENKVAEVNHV
jgi:regulator of RNase E activity RraB